MCTLFAICHDCALHNALSKQLHNATTCSYYIHSYDCIMCVVSAKGSIVTMTSTCSQQKSNTSETFQPRSVLIVYRITLTLGYKPMHPYFVLKVLHRSI